MLDFSGLRAHQERALQIAEMYTQGVRNFTDHKVVTANVTPGGGKTLMALLYADELLRAGLIDQVVVLVPRDSLASQMVDGWDCQKRGITRVLADGDNSTLANHHMYAKSGYVATYQAVAAKPEKHERRVRKVNVGTLLILDEPHHLALLSSDDAESTAWYAAVLPMFEAAKHVLLMSGTLVRHDGERIPFVTYDETNRPVADITYTRKQAIEEEAVLPLEITRIPADVEYQSGSHVRDVSLSEASSKEKSRALRAALERPEYRDEKTLEALGEWLAYRKRVHDSSAIVIVHNQKTAEHIARVIRKRMKIDVALAISSIGHAAKVIRSFRNNIGGKVLVTVGMAYEGLDVPHATHMVCLTKTRSEPWLEQAFARITRFNPDFGPYEKQRAFLYVPDDQDMRAFLDRMAEEQDTAFKEKAKRLGHEYVPPRNSFRALGATPGESRYSDAAGNLSDEDSRIVNWMCRSFPELADEPVRKILAIADRMRGMGIAIGDDPEAAE